MLALPEVLHVFDDIRLGTRIPTCPLLVVQSTNDQIIDAEEVDIQVAKYVDGGAEVLYLRDRFSEHISLMILGLPAMLDWLERRFDGEHAPVGTNPDTSIALTAHSIPAFLRLVGAAAETVVGRAG